METYTTGTGQFIKVHTKQDCVGPFCCIHNPSHHHMREWPTHWRTDRYLMERVCARTGLGTLTQTTLHTYRKQYKTVRAYTVAMGVVYRR